MNRLVMAALAGLAAGCQSAPAPEGCHYEFTRDKQPRRIVARNQDPNPTLTIVSQVETGHPEPGPGEYYITKPEGKHCRRVVVCEIGWTLRIGDPVEISADERCSRCSPVRVQIGKRVEIQWRCTRENHPN